MPEETLKQSVSSVSVEDAASEPTAVLCPKMKELRENSTGSSDALIVFHLTNIILYVTEYACKSKDKTTNREVVVVLGGKAN
jgi:hypothetical protein